MTFHWKTLLVQILSRLLFEVKFRRKAKVRHCELTKKINQSKTLCQIKVSVS